MICLTAVMMPYISEDDQHYRPVTHMIGDARETTYGDVIVNPKHFAFEIYKSNVCYGWALGGWISCKSSSRQILSEEEQRR